MLTDMILSKTHSLTGEREGLKEHPLCNRVCDRDFHRCTQCVSQENDFTRLQNTIRPRHYYNDFLSTPNVRVVPAPFSQVVLGTLCSKCQQIQHWLSVNLQSIISEQPKNWLPHHTSAMALERSLESGCHLCTLIWHSIVSSHRSEETESKRGKAAIIREKRKRHARIGLRGKNILVGFRKRGQFYKDEEEVELVIRMEMDHTKQLRSTISIRYFSQPYVSNARKPICTASEPSLKLIREWIEDCVRNHPKCNTKLSTKLPTRLLDVSQSDSTNYRSTISLVSTGRWSQVDSIRYAALSYCWGGSDCFKLTSTTNSSLEAGIDIEELPKTIQDAVRTTHFLGIRWLWVDSLCIIQDSPSDWATEASKMCEVYKGSYICIAALDSLASTDGLFALRDPLVYYPCFISNVSPHMKAYAVPEYTNVTVWRKQWPLHSRGWVIQERILSVRTIGFGQCLSWECREAMRDEFDVEHPARDSREPECGKFFDSVLGGVWKSGENEAEMKIFQLWDSIICQLSRTSLTIKSDRLAAVVGIASAIQQRTNWKFFAGIWEPFLVRSLLWKTYGDAEATGIGPTWSWISVTNSIHFVHNNDYNGQWEELATITVQDEQRLSESMALSKLHSSLPLVITCVGLNIHETGKRAHFGESIMSAKHWFNKY
jgi:Heterokaryon incompatibility protein (HET)